MTYPLNIAAPSWVLPADAKDNVIFLNHKVAEVELLCFEPSLPLIADFPQTNLTWHLHLPSSVPMDFFQNKEKYIKLLPFHEDNIQWGNPWLLAKNLEDIEFYAHCCVRIFEHCKELNPWVCVVHLPPIHIAKVEEKLTHFIEYWESRFPLNTLALENVRDAAHQNFQNLLCQKNYNDLRLCLDVAHAITFNQKSILNHKLLMDKVTLLHWSAPYPNIHHEKIVDILTKNCNIIRTRAKNKKVELSTIKTKKTIFAEQNAFEQNDVEQNNSEQNNSEQNAYIDVKNAINIETIGNSKNKNKDMHLPLYHLKHELVFCQQIMAVIPKNTIHLIEVFNWQGIEDSMDFFYALKV